MMGMVVMFITIVSIAGVDWIEVVFGFIPNIPERQPGAAEPTDLILSLVSTTALGFNLFLGGAMAKGKTLKSSQRGIAFSTVATFAISGVGMSDDCQHRSESPIPLSKLRLRRLAARRGGRAQFLYATSPSAPPRV